MASLVLGWLLMPRIGDNYSPWALLNFLGYLAAGPYFWVVGLVAAVLGLCADPNSRLRVESSREMLLLGLIWLAISLGLMRVGYLWFSAADSMATAFALVLFYLCKRSRPLDFRPVVAASTIALTGSLFVLLFSAVAFWHTIGKAWLFVLLPSRDSLLAIADALLLGDDFYYSLQLWRIQNPVLVSWADWVYFAFMQQFLWAGFYFAFAGDALGHRAKTWVMAVFLAYFLGTFSYFIIPSYGPAFALPELFADLGQGLQVHQVQAALADNTQSLAAAPLDWIPIFGFLAAMPSLHVGGTVLAALAAVGVMRWICWVWAAMTWVCTVILGWHWLWDGPAGVLLALLCWNLARRIAPPPLMSTLTT